MEFSRFEDRFRVCRKVARTHWKLVRATLFLPSPVLSGPSRRWLLVAFGPRIAAIAKVYPMTPLWVPWDLEMADFSWLTHGANYYSVVSMRVGRSALVSQCAHMSVTTEDYREAACPFVSKPIVIDERARLGACACVFKSVASVVGNPVPALRTRVEHEVPE